MSTWAAATRDTQAYAVIHRDTYAEIRGGIGAPGAVYTSTTGLYVLVHVRQRDRAAWERSWSPRSHPANNQTCA